jgi:hypothetical protein
MSDSESSYNLNNSEQPLGTGELNGKDVSTRNASMISPPGTIIKRRIRGALVPFKKL